MKWVLTKVILETTSLNSSLPRQRRSICIDQLLILGVLRIGLGDQRQVLTLF